MNTQQVLSILQNVFSAYMQLREAERPAALKRIVASFIEGNTSLPANLAAAADHLLPLVRPMVELTMWQLQCEARGISIGAELPRNMVPNRDVVLVTGTEEEAGLRSMVLHGRKVLSDPRPLSACTLKLEAGAWHEFKPDPSRPEHADLIELQEEQANRDYAEQKALLDGINKNSGIDVFVASHGIPREQKSGKFLGSVPTWTDGADALLPRAQSVIFVQLEQRRLVTVPWEKVTGIVEELLIPAGYWPERFRVRSFPTREQLARLAL